jgi:hypothetical protein
MAVREQAVSLLNHPIVATPSTFIFPKNVLVHEI